MLRDNCSQKYFNIDWSGMEECVRFGPRDRVLHHMLGEIAREEH